MGEGQTLAQAIAGTEGFAAGTVFHTAITAGTVIPVTARFGTDIVLTNKAVTIFASTE
jgi:hypothetical protein